MSLSVTPGLGHDSGLVYNPYCRRVDTVQLKEGLNAFLSPPVV